MEDENARMAAMKAKFEEEIAQLREDFTSMLRVEEAANKRMREATAKRKAANRESEAKLERSRKERSLGTSFAGQGGGNAADRRGTAVSAMGSMRTRGVSTGADLDQDLPYVSRGITPRFPVECSPSEYIALEQRFEVFIADQGLRHTISLDAPEIAVTSCTNNAYLFGQFGVDLVTDHRQVWWYISEATADAAFEDRLYECHSISDALRIMREWLLPLYPAERHLLVAELERVQFMGDEESEIVQFILRQFPERPSKPHTLTVGRGFGDGGVMGVEVQRRDDHMISRGGDMPRQQQQSQQHWSRDGSMSQQQQLQQHWSRGGGMPRQQQQLQQHWSRDGSMSQQQQLQQYWSRDGSMSQQQQLQQHWSRGSSHVFRPARQARQQQPLQQPSRGIPTIGDDGEDTNSVFPAESAGMMASAPAAAGTRGAATLAPAVAGSIGSSVFPAASAGMMASAPAAAGTRGGATSAPAVAGSIGGSVLPAASAGMMASAPAAAGTRGAATSAPVVTGSILGSVFPAASVGMMAGAPAAAGTRGAATPAPAVAGGVGGSVFPAESARMMAGAPAAAGSRGAAPVVANGSGGNPFPAESTGVMAGTPAAAGSSRAALQAASSAVRPPPAVAFASDDHEDCQVRRTATATRRQAHEVTPAMTRSGSRSSFRHDGVSGALAALQRGRKPCGPLMRTMENCRRARRIYW